ncbi:MAG: thiamine diphosphokinase [Holosporaceae bacterium]|jgi:thiamine pyrophosphokinase|nr:thiamine diphosphokinase [Holosporaceae bacterium]
MIKILERLSEYKSVLCLDGNLEFDLLGKIKLPIVACDGAADTLVKNGIEPSVIIGDLDSVDDNLLKSRKFIRLNDQNSTDFEKALTYIEEESLSPALVFGVDGGYIDHILGNIAIFSGTKFAAISKDIIFMSVDSSRSFDVEVNTKISIFGMPNCVIKSKGLRWELDNEELFLCGKSSSSNRAVSDRVELQVLSGKALVFIYTKMIFDAGAEIC